ncbi:hypothetical protein [Lewinella sp. LCG006]|uniref:hypothetical protein n=1 Tax=Lewinella sp. LCG006 TaxID=3231911 RepID=UPI0034601C86
MGKLVIHLGPPKTATTSFQRFFSTNKINGIIYHGVHQPRVTSDTSLCAEIYNFTTSIIRDDEQLKNRIERLSFDDNCIHLFSEEMFLVGSRGLTWVDKLKQLRPVLENVQYEILIVIRNPEDAIRSLYQEIFFRVQDSGINDINTFAKSVHSEIYMYDLFVDKLEELGFENIKILDYMKLINNIYSLEEIFNVPVDIPLRLNLSNQSKRKNQTYYANNADLRMILRSKMLKCFGSILPSALNRKIYNYLPRMKLNHVKPLDVNIESEVLKPFDYSYAEILSKAI